MSDGERRLAAILSADVVAYSHWLGEDEAGTLGKMRRMRAAVIDPLLARHRGRLVKTTGDGLLVEFASAVEATRCAIAIQEAMRADDQQLMLRIGLHVGDVLLQDDDIFGDGVNIAVRLEGIAEPGCIAVSDTVHENILGRVDAEFHDGGSQRLKNIARAIHVWRWAPRAPGSRNFSRSRLPLPEKPSIAVLPFSNMGGDPDQDHVADGIVESITAALSRIRAFFVIARNSSFAYKGRSVNVRDVGRELGVAYLLEGSVQRAAGRVRITVQLVETGGGAHLWAEKYDGTLDDVFDLQDQIATHVAGALNPSIRQAEIERSFRKRPQDLGAYDHAMRAFRDVWLLEKDAADRALEGLEQAIAIDPDYPLALALAAWCWAQRSVYNWVDDIAAAKSRALSLADHAAAHSTDDPLILSVLGTVHTFSRQYGAARVLLERAVALDPNSAWAISRLGWLNVYCDRAAEAEALFWKALRLSPLDPMNFNNFVGLASARQTIGDDCGAADLFVRALEERPNAHWIHRNLAPAFYGCGRIEEAHASRDALLAAYPNLTTQKFREAMVFSPAVLARLCEQLRRLGVPGA